MPKTLDAVILPGFMEKDEAVAYLREQCSFEPQLTIAQAEEIWTKYKAVVDKLPERKPQHPKKLPIPEQYKTVVAEFLRITKGPEVLDVFNIDPSDLVVYQLYVVTDRADHHAKTIKSKEWAKCCLELNRPVSQMPLRNDAGVIKVILPHAEHMFSLMQDGAFRIQQGGGFITVCEVNGRMLLKAGYHRSFAFSRLVRKEPDAKDKSLLVALTKTVPPVLLPDFPKQGLRTTVLGSRPPVFSDFFDESLAMAVKLRKKKFEMHIKVDLVQVDAS
jgi:hypothetical protein